MSGGGGAAAGTSPVPVRTYRPIGALVVACLAAASLLAATAVIVVTLPASTRAAFTVTQGLTLALGLGLALAVLFGIGRTRVRTDAAGLHVVNCFRTHDLAWTQAIAVTLGRGAPWAVLDTSAGDIVNLMAIQRSDGERAGRAVRELRAAVEELGQPPAHAPDGPLS